MNKERRDQLREAIRYIESAKYIITDVKEQEERAYDNLPEGLQYSDRGSNIEENVDSMDDIIEEIENIIDGINNIII